VLNAEVNPEGVPTADLLIHADFVRGLARDLVRDESAAEDLAQDAWVRALEKGPRDDASLRGWFATLLQNLQHNRRRAERRRADRERQATAPLAVPSAAHIFEREQVRERLVRAVMRLDEPFRSTVLLRYYEELPSPEIARRLGVADATVRTRLRRGLLRLREDLDGQSGGDRRAWSGALLGWGAGRGVDSMTAAVAGIVMKKLTLVVAAVLLFSASLALAVYWLHAPMPSPASEAQGDSVAAAGTGGWEPNAANEANEAVRERVVVARVPIDASIVQVFPADRGRGVVVGDVVDERGEPLPDIEVVAEPIVGTLPPRMQLQDDRTGKSTARTDGTGSFRLEGVDAGPTRIRAVLEVGRRAAAVVTVRRDAQEGPVRLRAGPVPPGDWVQVLVIDQEGQCVSGAEVEVFAWSTSETAANGIVDPRREPLCRGTTDGTGSFGVHGMALRSGFAFATAGDGRIGSVSFELERGGRADLRITLAAAASLRGRLLGVEPSALAGTVVSLHSVRGRGRVWGGSRRFDAAVTGDSFVFEGLPAGLYGFTLSSPGGARLVVEPIHGGAEGIANSAQMTVIEVAAATARDIELQVTAGGRLRGLVQSANRPVAGARVRAVLAPRTANVPAGFVLRGAHVWRFDRAWENCPADPLTHVETVTAADGTYALTSLQPGRYRVEVVANGLAYDRRMEVPVDDGGTTELEHQLGPAGVLQVAALDLSYLGVTRLGDSEPTMLVITDDEFVTFPGLAAGNYQVARFHSNVAVEPVVLGVAEVVAGQTTWLDLRVASIGAVVTGRVLSGGDPVADAAVRLRSASVRTDAFGAFRLWIGQAARIGAGSFGQHIRVSCGGVTAEWADASNEPRQAIDVVIEVGRRRLDLVALDAEGLPTSVRLAIHGNGDGVAAGVRRVSIEGKQPARQSRYGPMPAWPLHGTAEYDDGLQVSFTIPADAEAFQIERPVTVRLHVTVHENGKPAKGVSVHAHRWTGQGAPPQDDGAFREHVAVHHAKTGIDGFAELVVPPGDYLVTGGAFLSPTTSQRLRVDVGSVPRIELQRQ